MRRRRHSARSSVILGIALAFALSASPARADGERKISSLATSLARLRGEVEALSTKVDRNKADLRARMRSLATQKAELEIKIKREELRQRQLAKRKAEHKKRVSKQNARRKQLRPAVAKLATILRTAIGKTLPFKRKERLAEIDKVVARATDKLLQADAAIAQLWGRVEDELRLGRESGLYSQEITLDGKQHLVEVARVGMVMLYFRTRDGRYGMAQREGQSWRYVEIKDKPRWLLVAALFDAFKKQIRAGYFSLPQSLGGAQ
jgi:hypothetical protein